MHPSWNDYPHLVAELDPDGNKDLTLYGKPISVLELTVGTNKKIDWKCRVCEHEWKAMGCKRSDKNHPRGCPACAGQAIHSDGRNSMAVTHPDLAIEYQGDATQVIAGTNQKLLWKCSTCNHQWYSSGSNRSNKKIPRGCAVCNRGDLHSDGRNSMAITHPDLASEYQGDATKIITGTDLKIKWKCTTISKNPCDYEWSATGYSRLAGSGCPCCANSGFKPDQLGYYYVHKVLNESGETIMYKGGISGDWKTRLQKLRRGIPDHLTIENHEVIEFEIGQEALDLETTMLRKAAEEGWKAPPRKFDGGHELFLENPLDHARSHGLI